MDKKVGSIIICMLMAVSLVNTNITNVTAEDNANQTTTQEEEENATSGTLDNGNVKWEINGTELIITGNGKIDTDAFRGNEDITTVTIGDGITEIGKNAFYCCRKLENVTIPESVKLIESFAFYECNDLNSINLPNNITSINNRTFYNCKKLKTIDLPDNVTSIGQFAFYGCSSLLNIKIPGSVKSIGDSAFERCDELTKMDIPNGVESLGSAVFKECSKLDSITMPESVETIGASAFAKCSSLESIEIPSKVKIIAPYAFTNCSKLNDIRLPASVVEIGNGAFSNCEALTDLPELKCVKTIGSNAFYQCTGLTSITIPDCVTTIGESAFSRCKNLNTIVIPNSVTEIQSSAFPTINDNIKFIVEEGSVASNYVNNNNKNATKISVSISKTVMNIKEGTATTSPLTVTAKEVSSTGSQPISCNVTSWFSNNENVATVENGLITAKAIGKATITAKTDLGINVTCVVIVYKTGKASIADSTITCSNGKYTGEEVCAQVIVDYYGTILTKDKDYTLSYTNNINAGTATVIIKGIGNYTGIRKEEFTIDAYDLKDCGVELSQSTFEYTGKEIQPSVTVKHGDKVLKNGTDYTVTYEYNVNVGSGYVVLEGHGNYTGIIGKEFTISGNRSNPNDNDIQVNVKQTINNQYDLSDETKTIIQESTMNFLKKNYSKELSNLPKGAKIETNVSIKTLDESQLTQAQKDKIKNALRKGASILAYYDITISATAYTKDGNVISSLNNIVITQMDKSIQISMTIPNKYMKANRKFGIERLHDDEVTELTSSVKDNVITFSTDCFSIYALTAEDVKQEKVNTSDNLSVTLPLIAMGVSALLVIGLYVTRKKKA